MCAEVTMWGVASAHHCAEGLAHPDDREDRRAPERQYVDGLQALTGRTELLPFVATSVAYAEETPKQPTLKERCSQPRGTSRTTQHG